MEPADGKQRLTISLEHSYGCKNTAEIMALLDYFFDLATTGKQILQPKSEIDDELLRFDVNRLLDGRITEVISYSHSTLPIPLPSWVSKNPKCMEDYYNNATFSQVVRKFFSDDLHHKLISKFGADSWGNLEITMNRAFLFNRASWDSPWFILWDKLGATFWVSTAYCLVDCIFFYLGYCIVNDEVKAEQFKILLEWWKKCWLVGFDPNNLDTMLIICK